MTSEGKMKLSTKLSTLVVGTIAVFAAAGAPSHASQGINYAWCRYPGFSSWLSSNYSNTSSIMGGDFSLIHATGKISSVRLWVFPDGTTNVSLSSTVSSTFRNNLKAVVSSANSHGLAVYLTFFSNWNQGDATSGNESAIWTYDINPICSDMIGHYNIAGIDVMNEFDGSGTGTRTFCAYEIGKIRGSYNIYCTASSNQSYSTGVADFEAVGGNFFDLHVYSNSPSLPTNSTGYYGVIGEIGSSSGGVSAQETAFADALGNYSSRNWSYIYAWDYATDDSWEMTNAGQNWSSVSWNAAGSYWANN